MENEKQESQGQPRKNKFFWVSEMIVLDFKTGLEKSMISTHYFEGDSYSDALKQLNASGLTHLRLTGIWVSEKEFLKEHPKYNVIVDNDEELEYVNNVIDTFEHIISPSELTKGWTYDELIQWVELGDESDIRAALAAFKKDGKVENHVKAIEGYLKHKYGDK